MNPAKLLCMILPAIGSWAQSIPIAKLEASKLEPAVVTYQGKEATRFNGGQDGGVAVVKGSAFRNGTIEVEVAGKPSATALATARGFIGMAFRVQDGGSKYECIYLRPTNGRADDMARRNHSTQYISEPEWPWERLRKEMPGIYESYVDLESGAWTAYKVVVKGTRAELYVHGAAQPCLIVKDLRLGDISGAVALWVGQGTEGYFRNLRISGE